jgi:adenylate kinase family enzyme
VDALVGDDMNTMETGEGMGRVLVLGSGGAGKTVLARQLSSVLAIPVVHLDALYYDADWTPRDPEEFAEAQRQALVPAKVIIDGNYATSLPLRLAAADTVILLDLPARTCLAGILRRRWRYHGGQHADGVFDRLSVGFIRYVIDYRRRSLPRVLDLIAHHAPTAQVFRLASRREVARFLQGLGRSPKGIPDRLKVEDSAQ